MNIITGLYNKMMTFFQSETEENSRNIASNRLKLVLLHDRTKLDNLTLETMRSELIDVISKYIEIDKEALELNLEGEGDKTALMLEIPVVRPKTSEEIELARQETEDRLRAKYKEEFEAENATSEDEAEDVEEQDSETKIDEAEVVVGEELPTADTDASGATHEHEDDVILEEIAVEVEDSNTKKG